MNETLICVSDDIGVRVWLDRVLDNEWALECVSSSDLSRVSRLVQATHASVVMVAVADDEPEKSVKLFSAIQKANPDTHLVAVASHVSQDLLLRVMRAGARDCLIMAADSEVAKERLQALSGSGPRNHSAKIRYHDQSITMIVGASPVVDTRFFAQNLANEVNRLPSTGTVLAIDAFAPDGRTFYLDSLNRISLNELVSRTDVVDHSFVSTALEEYATGFRLLSGDIGREALTGDASADLFIALSQLAELFDHVVLHVGTPEAQAWMRIMGADISRLIVVSHPVVNQVQQAENLVKGCHDVLNPQCDIHFVIDGHEKRASLSVSEIEKRLDLTCDLTLPMEWQSRLDSINAGIPLTSLPRRSGYQKQLQRFVGNHYSATGKPAGKRRLFK
ncbi:response regulator receiver-like protein [Marinobacter daepoensis]|uniref:AAA family ATPase n=1 Tax=Marinobacter daepoensis TaxID=262077 RepID=UPI001C93DEA2|nr:response regulator receiver-like protein [Marinobacter daepoensis]MBY6033596.1 response regulator receiver-like protein [Marinobacter daepoensis]